MTSARKKKAMGLVRVERLIVAVFPPFSAESVLEIITSVRGIVFRPVRSAHFTSLVARGNLLTSIVLRLKTVLCMLNLLPCAQVCVLKMDRPCARNVGLDGPALSAQRRKRT